MAKEEATAGEAGVADNSKSDAQSEQKLTKKQLKALEFRRKKKGLEPLEKPEKKKSKEKGSQDEKKSKKRKAEDDNVETPVAKDESGEPSKRSKRRKKKSGDEPKEPHKKRLIVFAGNLPYECSGEELKEHLKAAEPAEIRMRKGFAFVEFDGEDAARKLKVALRLHHSTFKNRKINIELTAGGGGNNENRRKKLMEKRERLQEEHRERITKEEKAAAAKGKEAKSSASAEPEPAIHPSRLALMGN